MKIETLQIFTSELDEQVDFYSRVLEFEIIEQTEKSASILIGDSVLQLVSRDDATPYHYAINIPVNTQQNALAWLKARVEVLTFSDSEIQYFDFWDAYAIYFYDADKNICELIARPESTVSSATVFGKASMLGISEIGLPTTEIGREYKILNDVAGLPIFFGDLDRFCTVGDADGLFILIDKGVKKNWFPTTDVPFSSDFSVTLSESNETYQFEYRDEVLKVL